MVEFKIVKSKPEFSASKCGLVKFNSTGKILKPYQDKDGYLRVANFSANNKKHYIAVHRAVAEAWVDNPNPSEFNIVNHLDNVKSNNNSSNLEWTSIKLNRAHSGAKNAYPQGANHPGVKLSVEQVERICELLSLGLRVKDISLSTGVDKFNIYNIKKGKSWRSISSKYDLGIERKKTLSLSTLEWIKDQVKRSRTEEEIVRMSDNLDSDQVRKAIKAISLVCNDQC